jgi:glycosyltransferase involved in cell wall biosynthesis
MINMRWFSPLDSEKTEIARYSQALLPSLHKHFSLGLISDAQDNKKAFQCENQVVGMEPINIYNFGNSRMHCSILDLAQRQPGVVILHDLCLFELAIDYARKNADFSVRDLIINQYGLQAVRAFDRMFGGSAYRWLGGSQADYDNFVASYPLFQSFISNARGIVVHSDYALERVKKVYRGPVIKLELPYATPTSSVTPVEFKEPCQIVFCGHAGPNRRLREFIQAWAETSRPGFFRLSLYGAIDKGDEIMALAEELGLAELIFILGFVSEKELDDALSSSHLAVNLRSPTMGEASASQLRYWSKGLPSIVTDIGWYCSLPHDVVIKVAPDREKQDIRSILEKVISGKHSYAECGVNGYKYLTEKHDIEKYVGGLAEFVAQIEKDRFRKTVVDERLISLLGSMCEEIDDTVLFENVIKNVSETFSDLEHV